MFASDPALGNKAILKEENNVIIYVFPDECPSMLLRSSGVSGEWRISVDPLVLPARMKGLTIPLMQISSRLALPHGKYFLITVL